MSWLIVTQSLIKYYNLLQDMISSESRKTDINQDKSIEVLIWRPGWRPGGVLGSGHVKRLTTNDILFNRGLKTVQ